MKIFLWNFRRNRTNLFRIEFSKFRRTKKLDEFWNFSCRKSKKKNERKSVEKTRKKLFLRDFWPKEKVFDLRATELCFSSIRFELSNSDSVWSNIFRNRIRSVCNFSRLRELKEENFSAKSNRFLFPDELKFVASKPKPNEKDFSCDFPSGFRRMKSSHNDVRAKTFSDCRSDDVDRRSFDPIFFFATNRKRFRAKTVSLFLLFHLFGRS